MIPAAEAVARLLPGIDRVRSVVPLHGDGSTRRFFRVRGDCGTYVLLEGPDPVENEAYVRLARHLAERGIRVPAVYGEDPALGWIVLEDLGDRSLYAALKEPGADRLALYQPVLELLARMQVRGAEGFDLSVGFASAAYGPELMVQGEGLYFVREFADGLLGVAEPDGLRGELGRLGALGATAPGCFFLHRDFQSRNVQLTATGPALLDFQGARPGPLAYDAASLILDPYAGNSPEQAQALLVRYRQCLAALGADRDWTEDGWFAVGTFRLLQALGAFGKLGGRLGKPNFLEHAGAALENLAVHLGERGRRELPILLQTIERCRVAWEGEGKRRFQADRR